MDIINNLLKDNNFYFENLYNGKKEKYRIKKIIKKVDGLNIDKANFYVIFDTKYSKNLELGFLYYENIKDGINHIFLNILKSIDNKENTILYTYNKAI